MKTKQEIVSNWLPRYTGVSVESIGSYILLVNFSSYVKLFAEWNNVEVMGSDHNMLSATADDITIINFGMGSANAATIMDLLTSVKPKACLFLGKCGGLKAKNKLGDLIIPIAAIRGEGASDDYMPTEVPAMPAFSLQKAVSATICAYHCDYWTGTVYTTNRRVWEHDNHFKEYLRKLRCMAIDMETATLFVTGFSNEIPTGALLLVSDQPMIPEGVKTEASDEVVTREFSHRHLQIGIDSLNELKNQGVSVKHLRF